MNAKTRTLRSSAGNIAAAMLFAAVATATRSALATGPARPPAGDWTWKSLSQWPQVETGDDPIGSIANQMGHVVVDLKAEQTGTPVQTKEKKVVSDLDGLIAELTKQCKGGGGGANPNPTKPMGSSSLAKGPGGSGPMHDAKEGTRVWGQLPPKLREQILQSQTDGFPAGYEAVLASYYARLAQGQSPDAPDASATTPATRPAAP